MKEKKPNEESRSSHFQHSARVWDDLNYYYSENCTQKIITHSHKNKLFYTRICVGGKTKAMNCATGFCCCCWKYNRFSVDFSGKKASFELSFDFLFYFIEFLGCLPAKDCRFEFTIRIKNIQIQKRTMTTTTTTMAAVAAAAAVTMKNGMTECSGCWAQKRKWRREKRNRIWESGTVATTYIFTRTNNNIL